MLLYTFSQESVATKTDCEPFLRALEEQGDAIKSAAEGMMVAINTFKDSVASVLRSVDNLKRMVDMTRQAMVLAHGSMILERVEIKREPESSASLKADEEEDWGDSPIRQPSPPEDWDAELDETRCFALPTYRTVKYSSM